MQFNVESRARCFLLFSQSRVFLQHSYTQRSHLKKLIPTLRIALHLAQVALSELGVYRSASCTQIRVGSQTQTSAPTKVSPSRITPKHGRAPSLISTVTSWLAPLSAGRALESRSQRLARRLEGA
jgi:hypothetical protein